MSWDFRQFSEVGKCYLLGQEFFIYLGLTLDHSLNRVIGLALFDEKMILVNLLSSSTIENRVVASRIDHIAENGLDRTLLHIEAVSSM